MDTMKTYKIRYSIRDVIGILDSAPMHRDMVYETNAVHLTNRLPIAHLAIERGLKSLLLRAGKSPKQTRRIGHSLDKLYRSLKDWDAESADFLDASFQDAVNFFGYDVNIEEFKLFQSLYDYFAQVGSNEHFEAMRYWVIEDSEDAETPIRLACSYTHREILCALHSLFGPHRETVSERVEGEIWRALAHRTDLLLASEDAEKERSVEGCGEWLKSHNSAGTALEEAVEKNFEIDADNPFAGQIVRAAHDDLQQTRDPAVRYYIGTLSYLPRNSQWSNADPKVEWRDSSERRGEVVTAAGTCLGFIEWYLNGAWGIEPLESGPAGTKAIAWSHEDASHFLVNRLTREAVITANGNSKNARLVTRENYIFNSGTRTSDVDDMEENHDLEFWDSLHGLQVGDECNIECPLGDHPHAAEDFNGVVTTVSGQNVVVRGSCVIAFRRGTDV